MFRFLGGGVARFLTHSPSSPMTPSTQGLRGRLPGRAFGGGPCDGGRTSFGTSRWPDPEEDEELTNLSAVPPYHNNPYKHL